MSPKLYLAHCSAWFRSTHRPNIFNYPKLITLEQAATQVSWLEHSDPYPCPQHTGSSRGLVALLDDISFSSLTKPIGVPGAKEPRLTTSVDIHDREQFPPNKALWHQPVSFPFGGWDARPMARPPSPPCCEDATPEMDEEPMPCCHGMQRPEQSPPDPREFDPSPNPRH